MNLYSKCMASPAIAFPNTSVNSTFISLTDINPTLGTTVTFRFPKQMVADPLTISGAAGSEPNGKAAWWPYFQQRHSTGPYWVQGHMLNHNVHGQGVPDNLVPISNALNTNMSAIVEEQVKNLVSQGKILRYVVTAHWEGAGGILPDVSKHPEGMRKVYGIQGVDPDGTLLWGEQFAPTRLSWELHEYTDFKNRVVKLVALSRFGQDASQWNNNFPS